jgi:2-polyprenyl-3-methyl-5-hydroxy-6-metoxy-1,4-benzoquinol methylase
MVYSEYNFNNEGAAYSHSYLTNPVLKLIDKKINKKILDIGCGNGYLVRLLIEKGFDAYGIDASESGITIAKKYYPQRFFSHNIENTELPYPLKEMQFDTVISTEVIEHVFSPVNFLSLIKTLLLSSKGQVIFSTPYHGYLKNVIIAISGKWDNHHTVHWEGGHIKFWSRKTLTKLLNENGFKVTNFVGCGRVPYLWKSMLIKAEMIK